MKVVLFASILFGSFSSSFCCRENCCCSGLLLSFKLFWTVDLI